jgi:hypothetical protein
MVRTYRIAGRLGRLEWGMTRGTVAPVVLVALAALVVACNTSGLSKQPRATFAQLACYDENRDGRINAADAADPDGLPDFNADFGSDEGDAEFFKGVDIPLDAERAEAACDDGGAAEYLVAHGYITPAEVSCEPGDRDVLLVGVGGGQANLRERDDVSGIRSIIDGLQRAFDELGVETIAVIAGPAIEGASSPHSAMEDWIANAVRVYLERYPCIEVVLVGHSHGAITVDVAAARLERAYADRFVGVVSVDRIELVYGGDLVSRPAVAPVFDVHQTNDPLQATPRQAPNVETWDASAETAEDDDGAEKPVNHTTIDNSPGVRDRIVGWTLARWLAAGNGG